MGDSRRIATLRENTAASRRQLANAEKELRQGITAEEESKSAAGLERKRRAEEAEALWVRRGELGNELASIDARLHLLCDSHTINNRRKAEEAARSAQKVAVARNRAPAATRKNYAQLPPGTRERNAAAWALEHGPVPQEKR